MMPLRRAAAAHSAKVPAIQAIDAVTLATRDMSRAVKFYLALGFALSYGSEYASFTSFYAGAARLNLILAPDAEDWAGWGRVIFHVDDVDGMYAYAFEHGLQPSAPPADADWGERYFHIHDPDGHELSFAKTISEK
jgi:catechol 2,3-dioxygenase-like lactoylglutathione lyase family enzyme